MPQDVMSKDGEVKRLQDAPFLVLDLGLDVVNGIRGLDLEGDGLARHCRFC